MSTMKMPAASRRCDREQRRGALRRETRLTFHLRYGSLLAIFPIQRGGFAHQRRGDIPMSVNAMKGSRWVRHFATFGRLPSKRPRGS